MSAEILVMNENGVALATDSAVTCGARNKIYNSANKLFMLSKYRPLGIMLYNNVYLMGVPWEIIIKEFRQHIKDSEFSLTRCSIKNLFQYILDDKRFPWLEEKIFIQQFINNIIYIISNEYYNKINGSASNSEVMAGCIDEIFDIVIDSQDILENESISEYIKQNYGQMIIDTITNELIKKNPVFQEKECKERIEKLFNIVFLSLNKDLDFIWGYSGLVFAGYGESEIFPSYCHIKVYAIIDGKIIHKVVGNLGIDQKNTFYIKPFAQTDVVDTFIRGIDGRFFSILEDTYNELIKENLYNILVKDVDGHDDPDGYIEKLQRMHKLVIQRIKRHSITHYVDPFFRMIASMPKEHLAQMAESLVSLTSFRACLKMHELCILS